VAAGERKAAAQVEKDKGAAIENEKRTAEDWKVCQPVSFSKIVF